MARYDYHQKSLGDAYYRPKPKRKKSKVFRSLMLLILFAFVIALFIYVFPEVEVTIVPETETVENDFEVRVDSSLNKVDLTNNKFPGQIIQVEDELEKIFNTTGEKNIGDKAEGQVVFFNQTGLVQPITPQNSLVTDDGQVFFVKNNIEIPKAEVSAEGSIVYGNITAAVIAKEAGEEGNIDPGRLTIIDLPFSKQNKIYAEVKNRLTGGTSKVIKVASEEDLTKAEKNLLDSLNPKLKNLLQDELDSGQTLNDDMIEYETLAVEKTVELEEEIEEFNMKVKARAKALVWDEQEVKHMILDKIESQTASDKQLVETSQDIFDVEVEDFNLQNGTADLKIHTKNQISLPIDLNLLKDELKGLTEFEARRLLLNKSDIKDVRFKFRYSITNKIPQNGNRINIKMNF